MSNTRPYFVVERHVTLGREIRLYPAAGAHRFAELMASLYPKLASTVSVKRGYAAFSDAGFIGIMTSTGLTSVRRNPLLVDDTQLFLRALLAGLHADRHTTWSAYCDWDNYGTLRLMKKLGLGAKPSRSGHLSTAGDPDTLKYLDVAIERARMPYADHRSYAACKLAALTPAAISALIPSEGSMTTCAPLHSLDVTLL